MKVVTRLFFIFLSLGLLSRAHEARANVYAGQLKVTNPDGSPFDGNFGDGTGARFWFTLNDNATAVRLAVKEIGSDVPVYQADLGALSRGPQSATWDGTGAVAGKNYFYEVTAEQPNYSTTAWKMFFDSGGIGIFTRGADVVLDQKSPLFGLTYAPNAGGDLLKGILVFSPDGEAKELLVPDITAGGTVDWGGGSATMIDGILDENESFYVSAIPFGEVRRLDTDGSLTAVVKGLANPKGLELVGEGADKVLYICDDKRVVRAKIGNDSVFTGTPEVVAEFAALFPREVVLDDDGFMYVSFRADNNLAGTPLGLYKFDISGTLPVSDANAVWSIGADLTFRIAELEIHHGDDTSIAADDVLYYSTRAGSGNSGDGIWRVDDINSGFPGVIQLVSEVDLYGGDSNINERAGIAFDPAGNIVLMENSNEHVFFLSPPGVGATNSFTTTSPDTVSVTGGVSVADRGADQPSSYRLEQNYPNPFNPTTNIKYHVAQPGFTRLVVYSTLGAEVRELVAHEQAAGEYNIAWDGKDNDGQYVSSGVYILTMTSG
ncbi:T9SS type A sorting domain-containing protein, partial [candidate division KSB1 bacterium]|nr:T9SS type A sorting domain-containing protein [candidate division KSB1 bacterium]